MMVYSFDYKEQNCINSGPEDFKSAIEKLKDYKKSAWIPVTEEKEGGLTASKFGGKVALLCDEESPICPNCGNVMQMFLQLNSKELPAGIDSDSGEGLLQVFYCCNEEPYCEGECKSFLPFSKSTLLRVVPFDKISESNIYSGPGQRAFKEKLIVGWEQKDDYPNWDETDRLDISLTDEESDAFSEVYSLEGDKLLGWPDWVQAVEYPECPVCREPMSFIFQIDSDDNIDHMFGDSGRSYITQCKNHPYVLSITWDCY
jgi:uncharacterized protein YwqG